MLFRSYEIDESKTECNGTARFEGYNLILDIPNQKEQIKLDKIQLLKTDSVTNEPLPNTAFKLDFNGKVSELKVHKDCINYSGNTDSEGYYTIQTNGNTINVVTNGEGNILLKDVVLDTENVDLTVTENQVHPTKAETMDANSQYFGHPYYYNKIDQSVVFKIN